MEQPQPLYSLAREPAAVTLETRPVAHNGGYGGRIVISIVAWIILAVIVFLILLAARPVWVQTKTATGEPTGVVNTGLAVLWAILIALVVIIVLGLIWVLVAGDY